MTDEVVNTALDMYDESSQDKPKDNSNSFDELFDEKSLSNLIMEMVKEIEYRNKYGYPFLPMDRSKMTNWEWWLYKQYWPDRDV